MGTYGLICHWIYHSSFQRHLNTPPTNSFHLSHSSLFYRQISFSRMPMRLIPLHLQPNCKPLQNDNPTIQSVSLISWISAAVLYYITKMKWLMRSTRNHQMLRKFLLFSQLEFHQASKHSLATKAMLVLHYREQFLSTN